MSPPIMTFLPVKTSPTRGQIIFLLLLLISACSYDRPEPDIPQWLHQQILEDEAIIDTNPKLMPNFGAWYRFTFKGAFYYEYDNPLSSLSRNPYDQAGIRMDLTQPYFSGYWNERCCKKLIWKAPGYYF